MGVKFDNEAWRLAGECGDSVFVIKLVELQGEHRLIRGNCDDLLAADLIAMVEAAVSARNWELLNTLHLISSALDWFDDIRDKLRDAELRAYVEASHPAALFKLKKMPITEVQELLPFIASRAPLCFLEQFFEVFIEEELSVDADETLCQAARSPHPDVLPWLDDKLFLRTGIYLPDEAHLHAIEEGRLQNFKHCESSAPMTIDWTPDFVRCALQNGSLMILHHLAMTKGAKKHIELHYSPEELVHYSSVALAESKSKIEALRVLLDDLGFPLSLAGYREYLVYPNLELLRRRIELGWIPTHEAVDHLLSSWRWTPQSEACLLLLHKNGAPITAVQFGKLIDLSFRPSFLEHLIKIGANPDPRSYGDFIGDTQQMVWERYKILGRLGVPLGDKVETYRKVINSNAPFEVLADLETSGRFGFKPDLDFIASIVESKGKSGTEIFLGVLDLLFGENSQRSFSHDDTFPTHLFDWLVAHGCSVVPTRSHQHATVWHRILKVLVQNNDLSPSDMVLDALDWFLIHGLKLEKPREAFDRLVGEMGHRATRGTAFGICAFFCNQGANITSEDEEELAI